MTTVTTSGQADKRAAADSNIELADSMLHSRLRLFALSFLMLFLELALIRWSGSNVLYLAYFSNLMLLGSFLGIGVGFLRASASRTWVPLLPAALAGTVLLLSFLPVRLLSENRGIIFFGAPKGDNLLTGLPIWLTLPIAFFSVALVMACIGEAVARSFITFPPLKAYRLDIAGSLAGILAFTMLSWLGAPPVAWGAAVSVMCVLLIIRPVTGWRADGAAVATVQILSLVVMLAALTHESLATRTTWSPYYKIDWSPAGEMRSVQVNGIPHQAIMSLDTRRANEPFYFLPYTMRAPGVLNDVLVVGAGNGGDVAIALSERARHVDAVEIDPKLRDLGRRLNPNRPYQDRRVTQHITDGRAFLHRTDKRYDLIIFALPDSLTLVTGQSSLRLESYLFTREAIADAREHLRPHGTFAMYNFYRADWLVDRLANTLAVDFGHRPCVQRGRSYLAVMVVTRVESDARCAQDALWQPAGKVPTPATDDHPFLYLESRTIPPLYLKTLGAILLASLITVGLVSRGLRPLWPYRDLFLMGTAFLLLETKNIVQFALLFGTTWLVNALVFAAILVAVLLAIEVAQRWTPRSPLGLYVGLMASLAIAYAVPSHMLLSLDWWPRFAIGSLLAFTPIFLANLIFAERFKQTSSSTVAFGANLLGAMVGGVLEYASLVTGYRALLIMVAVIYVLAFVSVPRLRGSNT